ncbi:glycoside hydrolase family 3 C-terminal domain-containing protein [Phytohabitans flavus]|uniref:Beta-glucosidase n=1 Tax=Phytohabitans flavus TaxID=1076124 RepID=A0A6F8XZZ4_9ACTN|nr:glycoside hydrolase family 3 C-terminal domain-containing protein [Phytohabitans flavus]BCB79359.1 beta-glucosidase [Phytohabitans flavus]
MSVIEDALAALDLETKVKLLSGQDFWTLPAIPEIGLRSLVMSDGPIGLRGIGWRPDDPSVALPSPTALAATWDPALARTAGRVLGQEARRKGVHVLLAPTVNLHRSPLGGRHFECYSEDPLLTGEIGAAYVAGVQDQGVGTTVKHFVANDSETDRFTVDVRVGERALRELYLAPFERIVGSGAWGVMAAYNGVNGSTMTEHAELQIGLLKREWGFDGVIVSDWTAARSTGPAANGGLDVVMPAVGDPWGEALVAAVRSGAVPEEVIDDKVRRVLRLAARVGILDGAAPVVAEADRPSTLDGAAVARTIAARSFVLVRNEGGLLPLDSARLRTVAVSGALAADARVQGGGSALVQPARVVSPLDGLTAALAGEQTLAVPGEASAFAAIVNAATVTYAVGADPRRRVPVARGPQWSDITGVLRAAGGRELFRSPLPTAYARWMGDPPPGVAPDEIAELSLSARLTPTASGAHELAIVGFGDFTLTAGGQPLFEGPVYREQDESDVFRGAEERRFPVELSAGEPVEVVLTQRGGNPGYVSFAIGHAPPSPGPDALLDGAASAAAEADVAVVVVGTTEEVESEGFDRTTLALPGRQDELVSRVAAANPRTVVVVNAGSPVLMPWADQVAAILLTWFPGQEAGAALADVLLGAAEPGGRLPTTWPRRDSDALPVTPTGGALAYDEGVFLGYRADPADPLFPFGHGLGYTEWAYESLSIEDGEAVVTVRNSGTRPGREVVQVYAGPSSPDSARPRRWLAGFASAVAEPGEAVTVRVPLPERTFAVWEGGWQKVAGTYLVEAAHSVADRRLSTELTI